jgi:hypothetical protein
MSRKLGGGKVQPTLTEFLATLSRSSLPSVIVEGSDDIIVYRRLETIYSDLNVSVFPVGGRDNLILAFENIQEDERSCGRVFIADKDTWVISGVPDKYNVKNFLTTDGYSIENDLMRDGKWTALLTSSEKMKFEDELSLFVYWYSLALKRHLDGDGEVITHHPDNVFTNYSNLTTLREGEVFPDALKDFIAQNSFRMVRGKSLVALLMRQLSYSGRSVKHHHKSLMEVAAAMPGEFVGALFARVGDELKSD